MILVCLITGILQVAFIVRNNLETSSHRGLPCARGAAAHPSSFHPIQLVQSNGTTQKPPKRTVENSIILARKYKQKQYDEKESNPEGYIYEHYSPKSVRKFPVEPPVPFKRKVPKVTKEFAKNLNDLESDNLTHEINQLIKNSKKTQIHPNQAYVKVLDEVPIPPLRIKLKYSPPPPEPRQREQENNSAESTEKLLNEWCGSNNSNNNSLVKCVRTLMSVNMFRGGMKLKERFILGASVAAVLFTFLLVMDLQMDLGMSGHHLVPSHGKVKYVHNDDTGGSAYNSFRKRFLQKTQR